MTHVIKLTRDAVDDLNAVTDVRIRGYIQKRIDRLSEYPSLQGEALSGTLQGFRKVKVSGFRVIFRVIDDPPEVQIVVIRRRLAGDRQDAYSVAERRLN